MNLIGYSYDICLVLFILLTVAALFNLKAVFYLFHSINKRTWIILVILLVFSLFIRLYFVHHMHYVFYDEYEHINIAKNTADNRQFSCCNFYLDNKCYSSNLPQWAPGYHFLLSIFFMIFGTSEAVAYNFNAFLGAISILLLFLVAYLTTSKNRIALISAALLSLTPLHLNYSGNSSLEMCSFAFILLSVLSLLIFIRSQTKGSFFQLLAILAYTALIRVENIILLPLFMFLLILEKIDLRKFLKLSYLLILFLPYLFYLPDIIGYMNTYWLPGRRGVSLSILFFRNITFWFDNIGIPILYSLLAIAGAYSLRKNKDKIYTFFGLYFLAFLLIYTFVQKAELDVGDTQRYNLQFYFPVVIFAAVGINKITECIHLHTRMKWLMVSILSAILLLNFAITYRLSQQLRNHPYFALFQKQYNQFINAKEIDSASVFLSYNPTAVISTTGRPSVNISYLFDEEIYDRYLKDKSLILVDDYWCQSDKKGLCKALKNKYILEKVTLRNGTDSEIFHYIKR